MKKYDLGQKVKVEFFNDFHNSSAIGIAEIVSFAANGDTDYWMVSIPLTTRKRIEKKLCGMRDCQCRKIDSIKLVIDEDKKVLLDY